MAHGVFFHAIDAGLTVLAPNIELAAALSDRVERMHIAAGHDLWPTPRIRDFSGWLRQLYAERQVRDATLPRCLGDIEERELWRSVVLDGTGGADLLEPNGAVQSARRARRAMAEYGIPLPALAEYATDEAQALLQWNQRFEERCRDLDCIPSYRLLDSVSEIPTAWPQGQAAALNSVARRAPQPDSPDFFGHRAAAMAGIAWIESPIWRPVARRWLEANAGAALQPEAIAGSGEAGTATAARESAAARAGQSSGRTPVESSSSFVSPRVVVASSPAAELAAIAEWTRDHLRLSADFRAWICIPDLKQRRDQVVDAFDAALAPRRYSLKAEGAAPYAVAGGTPLSHFAPVRAALDALVAASGAISFGQFSALLRMPELSATPHEAAEAARLDVTLRGRGPSEATLHDWLRLAERLSPANPGQREFTTRPVSSSQIEPWPLASSTAGGASVAPLGRLRAFLTVLDSARGARRLSHWVTVWVEAFEAGPWALRQRWSSTEFQAAERLRELLASLATGDAMFGAQSGGAAGRLLGRAARDTAFQPQTGVPPIWISGQVMDPWLAYDGLWVAGCSEERWPPPLDPIALLPVKLQRDYGVIPAGVESQLRQAEELQQRWVSRATMCVFSCADSSEGREAKPSPLLPSGAAAAETGNAGAGVGAALTRAASTTAGTAISTVTPTTRSTGTSSPMGAPPATSIPPAIATATAFAAVLPPAAPTQPHWRAMAARAPRMDVLDDERAPPFAAGVERTRGVATLRAQSRCAFRGFAETRLRTEPLDRPVPGFNMRERGELLHHALEHVWERLGSAEGLATIAPDDLGALVGNSVSRAIARQCERRDPGVRWRRREQSRMTSLLGKWLEVEKLREPFTVEQLEAGAQRARHGGVDFNVRIDRIDRLADGGRVLIDYKSGVTTADWRGERPDNPQLPIYALLRPEGLVAVAYGKVNASDCGFVAESARAGIFKPRGRPSALEGMPDFASLVAVWSRRIESIAQEFAAGHAAVAPTPRACASCTLQPLCRVPAALDEGANADDQPP